MTTLAIHHPKRTVQAHRLPPWSPRRWWYAGLRAGLVTVGRTSRGVALGLQEGFDSGVLLDYVYANRASGTLGVGAWLDRLCLNSASWRAIRIRRQNLTAALNTGMADVRDRGQQPRIVDPAAGSGRYVLDVLREDVTGNSTAVLRDADPTACQLTHELASAYGLSGRVEVQQYDAFDDSPPARNGPRPNLAVVSGFYELVTDDQRVARSLRTLRASLADGGRLIYTGMPGHPRFELMTRCINRRNGRPWEISIRPTKVLDALVTDAGYTRRRSYAEDSDTFTVTVAEKTPDRLHLPRQRRLDASAQLLRNRF